MDELKATIKEIAVRGKGILAADESTSTITKRFSALGVDCTEETRKQYRELMFTAPKVNQYLAGVILYEETLSQNSSSGIPFPELLRKNGIIPGIKVDKGLVPLELTQ